MNNFFRSSVDFYKLLLSFIVAHTKSFLIRDYVGINENDMNYVINSHIVIM